jgi:hypothetical protein
VGDTASGKSASWADYDGDGDLDLYVANWACIPRCPHPFEGDRDTLYRNEGDGTFSDASSLLGSTTRGAGFIGGWTDYDNDGDLDLYVVNDEMVNPIGNRLFRNDGPGCDGWCFTDVAEDTGAEVRVMGMGLAIDDFDGDGWFDLYFSNVGTMRLLHNQGDGTFVEAAERTGTAVDRKAIGWGAVSLDYDNDGDRDLYLSLMANNSAVAAFNPLFDNQGDGTFTDLGVGSGAADPGPSVGLAYADYDNDGWVDLVVGNYDRGYHLYHNEGLAAGANRWLTLKLVGDGPVNRDAVGARVVLTTADGRRQEQEVRNSTGLGGGSDLRLHFGLGKSQVDTLEVRWPDGTKQTFSQGLLANHAYEIHHQGTVKET